jgi:Spy/CpxP family protein refolding chaperone
MVIFACGVITGALVTKTERQAVVVDAATNPPPPVVNPKNPAPPGWQMQRLEFFKRMEKQLDLAPEQREQVDQIMKESQERTKPLWEQIAPQMGEELKRVRQEVTKVLTPEQRKKMNELMRKGRKSDAGGAAKDHPSRPPGSSQVESNSL